MSVHALVALAAHRFYHADFVALAVVIDGEFNGGIWHEWSAKGHFVAIYHHEHSLHFHLLALFLASVRNTKGIPLADNFLEPGDIDNCKHGENAESGASVRRLRGYCKGKCTFTIFF